MVSLRHESRFFRRGQPRLPPLRARLLAVAAAARVALWPRRRARLRRALARRCAERSRSSRRRAPCPQRTQQEIGWYWRRLPSNFAGWAGRVGEEDARSAPAVRERRPWHRGLVRRQIRRQPAMQRADWAGF